MYDLEKIIDFAKRIQEEMAFSDLPANLVYTISSEGIRIEDEDQNLIYASK
jgi:hypothetical protein